MNLLDTSRQFLKNNASTILTCVGGVGVVATSVLSVKATSKAKERIEKAKDEKGEALTKAEVFVAAAPAYIPAVLTGASTIACIFGANILNKRQQASMISAYALLDNSYKEYKKKVTELYGEDADGNIKAEIARDKYKEQVSVKPDKQLFFDDYSQRYFESTTADVLWAEYELNRLISRDCGAFLNEFYELLDIDTVDFGNYMGWSSAEVLENQWYCWVEFDHKKVIMDDGLECTIIEMHTEPTFDFENY